MDREVVIAMLASFLALSVSLVNLWLVRRAGRSLRRQTPVIGRDVRLRARDVERVLRDRARSAREAA